jgi:hypothetical protein
MTNENLPGHEWRAEDAPTTFQTVSTQANQAIRDNPVPTIVTAIALGFALGILMRVLRPEKPSLEEAIEENGGWFKAFFRPLESKARDAYSASSEVVRGAVEKAVDKIHEVEELSQKNWWQRLWE